MKKIFTLFASLILTISVFAAAKPKNTLTVQSVDQGDLKVVIDGRRFEPNNNSIRINGLAAGVHQLKIYKEKNTGLFSILGKRYEVVFNNSINIKGRSNVLISIDRSGKALVTNKNGKSDRNVNDRNWNRNYNFDFDGGNDYGDYEYDNGNWGGYNNSNGYARGMDDREFSRVFQSIQKEWLESNKLKSATQIVSSNMLTSAQVRQLVLLFNLENNKLELAKRAYANTVDKRNYGMINDAFAFSNSKEELARFIRRS